MADLTEEDVPGAKLDVSVPALQKQKCSDLKFWLNCRGDSCKGFKTKAQMIEGYFQVEWFVHALELNVCVCACICISDGQQFFLAVPDG